MTVFLVSAGEYDRYRIVAAFSSREKAEAFVNEKDFSRLKEEHPEALVCAVDDSMILHDKRLNYQIEEMDLDSTPNTVWYLVKDIGVADDPKEVPYYRLCSYIRSADPEDGPEEDKTQADVDEYIANMKKVQ